MQCVGVTGIDGHPLPEPWFTCLAEAKSAWLQPVEITLSAWVEDLSPEIPLMNESRFPEVSWDQHVDSLKGKKRLAKSNATGHLFMYLRIQLRWGFCTGLGLQRQLQCVWCKSRKLAWHETAAGADQSHFLRQAGWRINKERNCCSVTWISKPMPPFSNLKISGR